MNRPELWLVRHGETEWSRDGRHTGQTDLPLTPEGEKAARVVASRLAGVTFDLVLSSPLRRAADTARLAGHPEARLDADAREWNYGEYEGVTTASIRETRPGWTLWADGAPGGEAADEVGARADRIVARVREEAPTRALLFAHGHFLRSLASRWIDAPVAHGAHLHLGTATLSVLGWEREVPAIVRWNA